MEESHVHKRLDGTSAVDVIAGNADLLSEILLRLPARSLIRFSLVCRLWFSLIANTQFRLRHCHNLAFSSALTPSGIYFYNRLSDLQNIESLPLVDNVKSLPPLERLKQIAASVGAAVKVTQSCNGLLMCVISFKTNVRVFKHGLVCNPAKNEHRLLPSPYGNKYYGDVYYNLTYDPSEPPYYKALCIKNLGNSLSNFEVSVYVPGSESWRSCCRFTASFATRFDSAVFWNGAVHWVGEYNSIFFDSKSEEIVGIQMPRSLQASYSSEKIRYFGEWGGHLHLIQVKSVCAKKFNVLELDKDTWKWSVKYRVHLAQLISEFPEMVQQKSSGTQYAFSILSVIRGEKEEESVLLLTIPGKVVAYNLVCKTAKVVCRLPGEIGSNFGDNLRYNYVSAYQYTESLAPVHEWINERGSSSCEDFFKDA